MRHRKEKNSKNIQANTAIGNEILKEMTEYKIGNTVYKVVTKFNFGGENLKKILSRLGRDYLKTGEYIEINFPDYDVRYIAVNDGVDTFKSENELMTFKNIFNDWFARDTSKKIKAVFKAKGHSGKHLGRPPYGYR